MAIKKYISPDVYPLTIRDNFRKLMGQHYIIDPVDNSVKWNPDVKFVYPPHSEFAGMTGVDYTPPDPTLNPTKIYLERKDGGFGFTATDSYGVMRDADRGLATLEIKITAPIVEGEAVNYSSLARFTQDLDDIFKNPQDSEYYFDRTFQYEVPEPEDYSFSSSYNYLVEPYEAAIQNTNEATLPNHYNIALVERADDEVFLDYDISGSPSKYIDTPFTDFELYQDTIDHTLLYGSINLSSIQDQGLYSSYYVESETTGLDIRDFMRADLDKTLEVKYINYFNEWADSYVGLTSEQQNALENKGKNIIVSGLVGTALVSDTFSTILPIQNKLPFHTTLSFAPESYRSGQFLTDSYGFLVPINPISYELRTNILYSSFGSYLAGVYDPSYVEPLAISPEYSFAGKTFIDSDDSQEITLLSSVELHDYVNNPIDPFPSIEANGSFISALTWYGTPKTDPSPVSSFATDNKTFIDYKPRGLEFETDLALNLADEDYVIGTAPALSFMDFVFQTTQLSDSTNEVDTDAEALFATTYGLGGSEGFANQTNISFGSSDTEGPRGVGRLYDESFEEGKAALNETVMYRIAKYAGRDTTTTPVQNIWIPSSFPSAPGKPDLKGESASSVQYIDSQVKFGQEYTYVVSAFKYVFGLKYRYERTVEPRAAITQTTFEGDTSGFIIEWTGFANLFSDWDQAIELIASSPDPTWAIYANLYDPSYNHTAGDYPSDAPGFFYRNRYFVSIERLNQILEKAWSLVPQSPYYSGGDADDLPSNQSWRDMFGGPWQSSYNITTDTPVEGSLVGDSLASEDRRGPTAAGTILPYDWASLDPATFSVRDWIDLFFGASRPTGGGEVYFPTIAPPYPRAQWLPPSHHLLISTRSEDSSFFALGATGFENLVIDGVDRITYGSLESIAAGASTTLDVSGYEAEYEIQMHPVAEIIEVPYFTTRTSVQSKPPPPPDVSIIPYRGVSDTLLFNLSANDIEVEQVPVPIEEGEIEKFDMAREAQGVAPGGKIKFVTDDTTAFFQVFRSDEPPSKYSDFAGKLRNTISTLYPNKEQIVRSTAASYQDKLQPNIKYYYTFRSVDYHGNISNPTVVYEVELVDDGGAVYLLSKIHDMPLTIGQVSSIEMKKFLQIIPSLSQVTADIPSNTAYEDPSDIPFPIDLGSDSLEPLHRIWDKKFKIRLTSKKTGKKIDLNVEFEKTDKRPDSGGPF